MDEFGNLKNKINIKDIKSSFIKKIIFSFITEKPKLYIIKYNNELQNLLSVGIKDYKNKSGKYKIGEKMEKGKNI